jgi:nucleoside-diphosphate-sugar epimerase
VGRRRRDLGGGDNGDRAVLEYGPGMDPEGRFIVVTGAADGIGGALVRALFKRAARSVVTADLDGGGRQANHDTDLSDAA